MIPKIIISGRFNYWCESAFPIEEAEESFEDNGKRVSLFTSNSCHFFCKNAKCVNKKNIVEIQKEYYKNIICKICDRHKIEWGFFLIIYKLKKEGLLPKNFACVCCRCYNEIGEEDWEKILKE